MEGFLRDSKLMYVQQFRKIARLDICFKINLRFRCSIKRILINHKGVNNYYYATQISQINLQPLY